MDLLQSARSILENAGFRVVRPQKSDQLYFENSTIYGFIWHAPSSALLLSQWQSQQDEFLRLNDRTIRTLGRKSWNAYSILLTEDSADEGVLRELTMIEEDFRGTRKIAQAGLLTRTDVLKALYPILPIENLVVLDQQNAEERLRGRISAVLPAPVVSGLLGDSPADDLADALIAK